MPVQTAAACSVATPRIALQPGAAYLLYIPGCGDGAAVPCFPSCCCTQTVCCHTLCLANGHVDVKHNISPLLLPPAAACRLAAATPAELKSSSHLAHCGEPLSLFSEQLALRSLRAACEAQLAALPTALAEDEALLSSMTGASAAAAVDAEEGMPAKAAAAAATQAAATGDRQQQEAECLELAVMWRVCYKRALVRCVQLCQTALAALAGSAADGGVQ